MNYVVADRVKQKCTIVGTGDVTLASTILGYRPFSDVASDGDTFHYMLVNINNGEWEGGYGTYNTGGTITRTAVTSSNSGAIVDFSAGDKEIFISFLSENIVARDPVQNKLIVNNDTAKLADLGDVDVTTIAPVVKQGLVWDGSNWVPGKSGGGVTYKTVSTDYTLEAGEGVSVDTTVGPVNITLPADPEESSTIEIIDGGGDKIWNPVYVRRNGNTIMGKAEDLVYNVPGSKLFMLFDNTTWRLTANA